MDTDKHGRKSQKSEYRMQNEEAEQTTDEQVVRIKVRVRHSYFGNRNWTDRRIPATILPMMTRDTHPGRLSAEGQKGG